MAHDTLGQGSQIPLHGLLCLDPGRLLVLRQLSLVEVPPLLTVHVRLERSRHRPLALQLPLQLDDGLALALHRGGQRGVRRAPLPDVCLQALAAALWALQAQAPLWARRPLAPRLLRPLPLLPLPPLLPHQGLGEPRDGPLLRCEPATEPGDLGAGLRGALPGVPALPVQLRGERLLHGEHALVLLGQPSGVGLAPGLRGLELAKALSLARHTALEASEPRDDAGESGLEAGHRVRDILAVLRQALLDAGHPL
mmetsp:Transcript_97127/g.290182  ORF Transcript_97127/g.290182 Transcript_97127/m.290182 type:complete len:253 (+) Transcript_97127:485-1243(+)